MLFLSQRDGESCQMLLLHRSGHQEGFSSCVEPQNKPPLVVVSGPPLYC